jgi:hypothetical protein
MDDDASAETGSPARLVALEVYPGFSPGMGISSKDQIRTDLLALIMA